MLEGKSKQNKAKQDKKIKKEPEDKFVLKNSFNAATASNRYFSVEKNICKSVALCKLN